ncbi:uncharacterized protein LOC133192679 [Saccostrea echinata]|uniref:uncharacterized protein LOC133192679 n=1 Tax=Saccostrea echinata TaxID=191078 RepID=UPI002A827853|nr:uncharacterized protein LOC133192679 [Saccostrea echinata]
MLTPGRLVFLGLILLLGVCYGQPPQSDAGTGVIAVGAAGLLGLAASNAVLAAQNQILRRNCNKDCVDEKDDCEEKLKKCEEEKKKLQQDLDDRESELEEAKKTIANQNSTIQGLNQQVVDLTERFSVAIDGIGFLCEEKDTAEQANCLRCSRILDNQTACAAESSGMAPLCRFDPTKRLCIRQ